VRDLIALARRARDDERGFTMIIAMGVLLVLMGLGTAALLAVGGDLNGSSYARSQKQALAAAQAGLDWYEAQLSNDPSYWTKCTTGPTPSDMKSQVPPATGPPVNDPWNGVGTDPRRWRTISPTEQYTIELLPANGAAACSTASPDTTFVDQTTRTFRIRTIGRAGAPPAGCGTGGARACPPTRTLVATFHRQSFLDYLYFTDRETYDPLLEMFAWKTPDLHGNPTATTSPVDFAGSWAPSNCSNPYWDPNTPRAAQSLTGETVTFTPTAGSLNGQLQTFTNQTMSCPELSFANADTINGPFHSNDSIQVCGHPTFGRSLADSIEIANQNPDTAADPINGDDTLGKPSWRPCNPTDPINNSPNFKGTPNLHAKTLAMPASNASLASSAMQFTGKTTITLNGTTISVTAKSGYGTPSSYSGAFPASGVIYVNNGSDCTMTYNPLDPRSSAAWDKCAVAYVKGHYKGNLTIASAQDIVIQSDATNNGVKKDDNNSMLGLVANNWVRVDHPVASPPAKWDEWLNCASGEPAGVQKTIQIDAAILAINDSFIVDNWLCGGAHAPVVNGGDGGGLIVNGVIAQKYRGPVSYRSVSGNVVHGYAKIYNYDDRLRYRSPPQFLDPAQAAWTAGRVTEQVG